MLDPGPHLRCSERHRGHKLVLGRRYLLPDPDERVSIALFGPEIAVDQRVRLVFLSSFDYEIEAFDDLSLLDSRGKVCSSTGAYLIDHVGSHLDSCYSPKDLRIV